MTIISCGIQERMNKTMPEIHQSSSLAVEGNDALRSAVATFSCLESHINYFHNEDLLLFVI